MSYFDDVAELVSYAKKTYPDDKIVLGDNNLKVYSAKLWTKDYLITECMDCISTNPINIIEQFIEWHEICISELEPEDSKRDIFSAVLATAYTLRSHLREYSK